MMKSEKPLFARYHHAVLQKVLAFDDAQFKALHHLQALLDTLHTHNAKLASHRRWPWPSPAPITQQGLYLFGEVGRGKSMLVSWFYESCPLQKKRRLHFHVFMQEVHAFIHQNQTKNALHAFAKKIKKKTHLLCFDEFYISDIADAMLLSGLFSALFSEGITLVITSNYHPDTLYPNGLQRASILPFIALLHERTALVELTGKQDYRLAKAPHHPPRYRYPLSAQTEQAMIRSIPAHVASATYTFAQLCAQPKGAKEYLTIAQTLSHLVLTQIPQFTQDKNDEIRRFMTLIDVLYEYNVTLLCVAQVAISELYPDDEAPLNFQRTRSRLIEMQAEDYPPPS